MFIQWWVAALKAVDPGDNARLSVDMLTFFIIATEKGQSSDAGFFI